MRTQKKLFVGAGLAVLAVPAGAGTAQAATANLWFANSSAVMNVTSSGPNISRIDVQVSGSNAAYKYQLRRITKGGAVGNVWPSGSGYSYIYPAWGQQAYCNSLVPRRGDAYLTPCTTWESGTWDYHQNLRITMWSPSGEVKSADVAIK